LDKIIEQNNKIISLLEGGNNGNWRLYWENSR
jgi:hypothetical protein